MLQEYFKHEGYHNVKCISKELGYRNNRGTRRWGCIPEFLHLRGVRLVGEVWGTTKVDLNATKAHPILRWTAPQRFGSPSTIGFLQGGNRSLYNNDRGHNPQLDWGLPNSYNRSQRQSSKYNNGLGFPSGNPSKWSLKWMRGKWRTAWWRCRSGPSP